VLHVYTMEQIHAFASGARANCASELADISFALRAAQAKEKDWRKYIDGLSKSSSTPKPRREKDPKGITKEQAILLRKLLAGKSVRTN
jgi:hypothetical protein